MAGQKFLALLIGVRISARESLTVFSDIHVAFWQLVRVPKKRDFGLIDGQTLCRYRSGMGANFLRHSIRVVFWLIVQALGGIRIRGKENVPAHGGALLCPNHVCDIDPAAVYIALPRFAHYLAKEDLFQVPVLGWLIRVCRAFPIHRDSADLKALRHAEGLLKSGEALVIFPEGGGNHENALQPLQPGALLLALRARAPVIPVALVNTNAVMPYGTLRPRRSHRPVEVIFGAPLDLSDLYGKRGAVEEATRRLTVRLAEMLGQPLPTGPYVPHDKR